jgi:hypothetical protein
MKIIILEESADFATLDTEKLFSKLKSYELSIKGCPNHDVFLTSKALITSAYVSGHDANPTNTTVSSALEFALSSLTAAFDEQYESIPDDEIVLLARKFCALHKFHKERTRSLRGCFECDDTTHFIADCQKRKKLDSSNKYDYTNRNDYNKSDNKKENRFGDKKKKKRPRLRVLPICAAHAWFPRSSFLLFGLCCCPPCARACCDFVSWSASVSWQLHRSGPVFDLDCCCRWLDP